MARTGAEYLKGIKDNRNVWVGKDRVEDVTEYPPFAGSIEGISGYYDYQHKHTDECLVPDPESGTLMSAALIVPRNAEDLETRFRAFDRFARYSYGMLGRTPDYMHVSLVGFIARSDVFHGETGRRLRKFYREVVDGDLALTHTIIQPAIDKGVGELEGVNADLALRAVGRTENGVIVRGAKVLATLGPFADELFVYPSVPLAPGTPKEYALAFSVPVGTKGVITLCRDHYGTTSSREDQPFSSVMDEQDAYVIFDDVEVPHERMFIDCDLEMYNSTRGAGRASNTFQQTMTRAARKFEFIYDLCNEMARIMNVQRKPDIAAQLGEIWCYAGAARAAVRAGMAGAYDWGAGAFFMDERPLRAIAPLVAGWMVRANSIIKDIGGANLLATPSLDALKDPEMGPLLKQYLPGANGISAEHRSRIFRTAWDFCGSALGSRVELYERFYLASQPTNFRRHHMQAMAEGDFGLLKEFLAS